MVRDFLRDVRGLPSNSKLVSIRKFHKVGATHRSSSCSNGCDRACNNECSARDSTSNLGQVPGRCWARIAAAACIPYSAANDGADWAGGHKACNCTVRWRVVAANVIADLRP